MPRVSCAPRRTTSDVIAEKDAEIMTWKKRHDAIRALVGLHDTASPDAVYRAVMILVDRDARDKLRKIEGADR